MGAFNLENYSEVKDRITNFIVDFPTGVIQTFMRHLEEPLVVFEAKVFRTPEEVTAGVYTSGWSREIEGPKGVNKTSHLENCETSAIGRALANMGYASDVNRASRSEMLKVERMNKEHDEMLAWIRSVFPTLTAEDVGDVNGEEVNLRDYIKAEGATLPDNFLQARTLVTTLEKVLGLTYGAETAATT